MDDELVAIARVVRSRGLKGEVVAEVLTDFPERFDGLSDVTGVLPDGSRRQLELEGSFFQKDRIVLKFAGIDSIEAAEELRNTEVCVPEEEAVGLGDDEFFDWELAGCVAATADGEEIGVVREVMRTGAGEILVIEDASGREVMVPFVAAICTDVDVAGKRIVIDPPEGLLEF